MALAAGIAIGFRYIGAINRALTSRDQTLAIAKGALAEQISNRFTQWSLSQAEREVALFALKGCDVTEIARLRRSANGTIRSQLSQIYAKAGVTSQATFLSLFLEDLIDSPPGLLPTNAPNPHESNPF